MEWWLLNINMVNYKNLFKSSLEDFKRNKVRTFLTSLGIMVGVFSVVILIALGLGLKNYIEGQFQSMGANLIMVLPGSGFGSGEGGGLGPPGFIGGAEFDERDVVSLKKIQELDYIMPVFMKGAMVESSDEKNYGQIFAINEEGFKLMNLVPEEGKLFDKSDVQGASKIGVLGNSAATKLFGGASQAIGQTVRFENLRYKIIGVAKKKGDSEPDNAIFIPYKSTYGNINPDKTFFGIYLGVKSDDLVTIAKEKVEATLMKRYEKDDFAVTEQAELLSSINQIFGIINTVLIAIGSISLFVGGIGIMNIMYSTVTERTKEIGIRRAIGATEKDILLQFLSESIVLSLFGGISGLLLATIVVLITRFFFPASLNLTAVLVALFVSSGIGIIFGVFPARRAAKLSPIDAIRYE